MITFRYYDNSESDDGECRLKSKLNIIMFKSYKLLNEGEDDYLMNTKENYSLFHTLKECQVNPTKVNFRNCVLSRLIKVSSLFINVKLITGYHLLWRKLYHRSSTSKGKISNSYSRFTWMPTTQNSYN